LNFSFKNILVVSPHPDDSEYSCYGIIKKLNSKTTILVCSSGGMGDETNYSDRILEVKNFWKTYDREVELIHEDLLSLPYHEAVKYLDSLLENSSFDAVFITPEDDTNQEHRHMSAVIKSSLRNKNSTILEYWTPSTNHGWEPNIWLSIEESLFREKNNLLLSSFKSQNSKSYFQQSYIDSFHRDWQAIKRGIPRCEKFKLVSWMGS